MKKQFLFLGFLALVALNTTSCNKSEDDPKPDTNNPKPNNPDPDPSGTAPTAPTPTIMNVHGTLVSVIMQYSYTVPVLGQQVNMNMEVASAAFFTSQNSSTMADAGTVSVNTYDLDKADNNAYYKAASDGQTPSSLDFTTNTSSWTVAGSGSVSGFTYDHTGAFPDYDGTLPSTVTKSSGLTISLAGDVSNADSVYVVVIAGDKFVQKAVGGNAVEVVFSASDLSSLPTVSDNSALLEVVPYRLTLETIGGKQYAFIKEKAVVGNINIE
jgi:hypothetical protein